MEKNDNLNHKMWTEKDNSKIKLFLLVKLFHFPQQNVEKNLMKVFACKDPTESC